MLIVPLNRSLLYLDEDHQIMCLKHGDAKFQGLQRASNASLCYVEKKTQAKALQ